MILGDITTSRHDVEFYRRLPKPDHVDLCAVNSVSDSAQVCRTCTNAKNPLWNYTHEEQIVHINAGKSLADLACAPDKSWGSFRVLNQTDYNGRIVPLDYHADTPTRAIVDTCGQQIRQDCSKCDRFEPVTVSVAFTSSQNGRVLFRSVEKNGSYQTVPYTTDNSPVRYWKVTVGGHCTIPADGIVVDGHVKTCDWQPRKKRVESPSCANCFYLDYKGENWQFDHLEVNENAWLTPWERENIEPDQFHLKLWAKQSSPIGRRYWFPATVLDVVEGNAQKKIYHLRFDRSLVEAKISEDDERFLVYVIDNERVAVDILYPWNKLFNLHMPTKRKPLLWPKIPDSIVEVDNCSLFVKQGCSDCRPHKACYYHAKAPIKNELTNEIVFARPVGKTAKFERPLHAQMRVIKKRGRVLAVDFNGNKPVAYSDEVANASTFRLLLPSLLKIAKENYGEKGYKSVMRQYFEIVATLSESPKANQTRPVWLRPSSREPNKPYCSHPQGADLRKVFQDSFGSERVDWEFDHGAMTHDETEEELRVGYRQHEQTPQRLQEEILASDASHPRYDPASGHVPSSDIPIPTNAEIHRISAIGDMYHEDGTPVTSTSEFYEALDGHVRIGDFGEVDRTITKRRQLFGYDLSHGLFGKRKGSEQTALPANDPTYVIFDLDDIDPDQLDIADVWHCTECEEEYDLLEIDNFFEPTCTSCGGNLYKNHTARMTYNPREGGGIGNAFAKSSAYTLAQQRLYSTLCSHWRLNAGTTVITLDDIHGPSSRGGAPAASHKNHYDDPVKIITVGQINAEQKAVNDAYSAEVDAVMSQREAYLNEHPGTSPEELEDMYPTPRGTVYHKKAEGSLSKMGGV